MDTSISELLIALSCRVISKRTGTIILAILFFQSLSAGEGGSSNRSWVPLSRWSCKSPQVMHRYLVSFQRIKQMRDLPVSLLTKFVQDIEPA